jgi:transposase InsO family protein
MARKRRSYTPEFKAEAVRLVTEQGYSVAEAARSLGVHETLLRSWKQAAEAQGERAFPGPGKLPPLRGGEPPPAGREQAAPGGARHPKKSYGALRPGGAVIFRFIEEHRDRWPVRVLCQALGVSLAGYYAWRERPASARRQRHDALLVEIRAIHADFRARYGSPRIHAELVARGHDCCVNTVAKLMRGSGVAAKTARKFRCTTDSDHDLPVAENLRDRQFDPEAPNEAWVADITCVPTREGWLYLAAVEDLYSRRVVGWSMAERLESRLVVDALALAVEPRLPGEGLLAHSDRGSQYASDHYQALLARRGITCSMSRRADCWDNAPMESFFASLKKELVHGADFATRAQARAAVVEYIEVFYNTRRRHSSLGHVSPAEYEQGE